MTDTLNALVSLGLKVERRIIVQGWKGSSKHVFTSCHSFYTKSGVDAERARIGEELPDWQPHITDVWVEERVVSDWKQVVDPK